MHALTQEQKEFFACFGIAPPEGISLDGIERFIQAYLRDPAKRARWDEHRQRQAPASAMPVVSAPGVPGRGAPTPTAAPPAPAMAVPAHVAGRPEPFRFTGSGGEYFGIWIVNLLLTIVTLGIYSAWAKVRRLQYFYRHTELAGASFDYHGTGEAIFKGRLVAFGLFMAYNYSFQFSATLGVVTLVLLAAVLPWLLRASFRFRLRNTSWRGLRFRFAGSGPQAYMTFLVRPILVLFSLYLAAPWFHQRLKAYQHGNSQFGTARFAFTAGVSAFYLEYLILSVLMAMVMVVPFGMLTETMTELARTAQETGAKPDPQAATGAIFLAMGAMFAGMMLISPMWQARLQNLVWNHTTLDAHRFESRVSPWKLLGIHVTNLIGIVLTLGFFMPWAAVRVARHRVESMTLVPHGSLDDFVAGQEKDMAAVGEETAEMFDIDIAL